VSLLPVRLEDLLHARTVESVRIDFKASWNEVIRAAAIQTIAAFANDFQGLNGGYVILGVEDSHGQPVLPPRGLDGLDLERVQKEIRGGCERISPGYQPIILPEVFEGKPIIVIYAPMGDARPYQAPDAIAKGATLAYYVRIGAETHVAKGAVPTRAPRGSPASQHPRGLGGVASAGPASAAAAPQVGPVAASCAWTVGHCVRSQTSRSAVPSGHASGPASSANRHTLRNVAPPSVDRPIAMYSACGSPGRK